MPFIKLLFSPLVFALAFLGPLIAQVLSSLGLQFGAVSNLTIGLALGLTLGLIAQLRGSWVWFNR